MANSFDGLKLPGESFDASEMELVAKIFSLAARSSATVESKTIQLWELVSEIAEIISADISYYFEIAHNSKTDGYLPNVRVIYPNGSSSSLSRDSQQAHPSLHNASHQILLDKLLSVVGNQSLQFASRDDLIQRGLGEPLVTDCLNTRIRDALWSIIRNSDQSRTVIGFFREASHEDFSAKEHWLASFLIANTCSSMHESEESHLCNIAGVPTLLSSRRREVLNLLLSGEKVKAIASKLGLSPFTVGDHVKAIYRQFGVRSRSELLSLFIRK